MSEDFLSARLKAGEKQSVSFPNGLTLWLYWSWALRPRRYVVEVTTEGGLNGQPYSWADLDSALECFEELKRKYAIETAAWALTYQQTKKG